MKKLNKYKLYASSLIVLGLTLSACQKDAHKDNPAAAPSAPEVPSSGGTADAGGGNAIGGRPIESYRVDPTKLDAYIKVLKPKFDFDRADETEEQKKQGEESTRRFINNKNWYIAPINLKTLDNKTLGLSVSKDSTQQLAAQTNNEIWIDQRLWDKLSLEDQATLIVHEYVMMLYLLRFESGISLCKKYFNFQSTESGSSFTCEDLAKYNDEEFRWILEPAIEPSRQLEANDYANIRIVTANIMNANTETLKNNITDMFIKYNFDPRIFNEKNNSHDSEKQKKDKEEFSKKDRGLLKHEAFDLVKKGLLTGQFASQCHGTLAAGFAESCEIKIEELSPQKETGKSKIFQVSIVGDKAKIETEVFFYDYLNDTMSRFNSIQDSKEKKEFLGLNSGYGQIKIPGIKYFEIYLAVKKTLEWSQLKIELLGVIAVEKVYVGTFDVIKDGKKSICEQHSYTLNEEGKLNYLIINSKNNKKLRDIESVIENYWKDYDCRGFN